MSYRFPEEHGRRIAIPRDETPTERRIRSAPPASSPPGERRKSRPSFAEIDVVEADLANDARFERE